MPYLKTYTLIFLVRSYTPCAISAVSGCISVTVPLSVYVYVYHSGYIFLCVNRRWALGWLLGVRAGILPLACTALYLSSSARTALKRSSPVKYGTLFCVLSDFIPPLGIIVPPHFSFIWRYFLALLLLVRIVPFVRGRFVLWRCVKSVSIPQHQIYRAGV